MITTSIGYIINETHDIITGIVYHDGKMCDRKYSPRFLPLGLDYSAVEGINTLYTIPVAISIHAPVGCRITLTITGGAAIVMPGGAIERIWIRSDGVPYILDAQGNQILLDYQALV